MRIAELIVSLFACVVCCVLCVCVCVVCVCVCVCVCVQIPCQRARTPSSSSKSKKPKPQSSPVIDIEDCSPVQHSSSYHEFTSSEIAGLRVALLDWYRSNRRWLPWRGDPPPYGNAQKDQEAKAQRKKKSSLLAYFQQSSSCNSSCSSSSSPSPSSSSSSPIESSSSSSTDSLSSDASLQPSAYSVWVSEVMLQQTRVETVIEYFTKWMRAFPTVADLARASLEDVNKIWAGLGYYRRAKYLHEGAKVVLAEHGGSLPNTVEALKKIPGIGPYTAGAVASIAFGECAPLVDGNVIRVLSRLRGVAADPSHKEALKLYWRLAAQLVDPHSPGDFNQSLMELGATICAPKSPSCAACPVRAFCHAYAEVTTARRPITQSPNDSSSTCSFSSSSSLSSSSSSSSSSATSTAFISSQTSSDACSICASDDLPRSVCAYPLPKAKKAPREENVAVAVVTRRSNMDAPLEYLLCKRPAQGLLANQWELPSVVLDRTPTLSHRKAAIDKHLIKSCAFSSTSLANASRRTVGHVVHVFSHIRHTMMVEAIHLASRSSPESELETKQQNAKQRLQLRWLTVQDMKSVGLTTGVKKVLRNALSSAPLNDS